MSNMNEQMNDDVLETRTGIRVLANNEIAAVAGAIDGLESFHFALSAGGISWNYLRFLGWWQSDEE